LFQDLKTKTLHFREKHETKLEIAFFLGGFIFDAIMFTEVDDLFAIVQQAVYLFLIAVMIHHELLQNQGKWQPAGWVAKIWKLRAFAMPFFLGTLLNLYSIMYFKSASIFNSLIFLLLMMAIIIANELPVVKKSHVSFKVGLYGICLFSFLAVMFPILLGFVGWIPFGLAIATTLFLFYVQFRLLKKTVPDDITLFRAILAPGFGVVGFFMAFYFLGLIPPVPLAVKQQGIYHAIEKKEGEYYLSSEKVWWKIWQSGDQDFLAEPGDKIYFYAEIFSPARFQDRVYVHWAWKSPKGDWQNADRIPLNIVGGRKEGYRGYATKSNYQPGDYRVQVKSENGQEISRLYFTVTIVPKNEVRRFEVIRR
jgi:hypothetical protein